MRNVFRVSFDVRKDQEKKSPNTQKYIVASSISSNRNNGSSSK